MNQQSPREELRDAWIESLLLNANQQQDNDDRIAQAMGQIEPQAEATTTVPRRSRYFGWGSIGIAIAVLLAWMVFSQSGNKQAAMAAVKRSLDVAGEQTARKYLLHVAFRPLNGKTLQITNDLYVEGKDRFALRHPGLLPGTSFWLGQNGRRSWVLPALGPALQGDNTILSRWLRSHKELDTPYLHVSTVLNRMMSRGYQLEPLPDERITLEGKREFDCEHVRARRTSEARPHLPETIELWASRESGMAVRLVAQWELDEREVGIEGIELTFQSDEPDLPDDWFGADGHRHSER